MVGLFMFWYFRQQKLSLETMLGESGEKKWKSQMASAFFFIKMPSKRTRKSALEAVQFSRKQLKTAVEALNSMVFGKFSLFERVWLAKKS
jgi:hypothetical protein